MGNTILLVDDLQMFLEIEKAFFEHTMVDILTAKNGMEALIVMNSEKIDLVFMDLEMPTMDGATCCKMIKSSPVLSNTPVVIVTSNVGAKQNCIDSGCNYFLTKPAGRERFLEIAREFIPTINRREKRVNCSYKCIAYCNGQSIMCYLYDLSIDGAFIVTDYQCTVNEVIRLSLTLPNNTIIDCHSKVVWKNENVTVRPKGLGVKFALISKESKAQLAKLI